MPNLAVASPVHRGRCTGTHLLRMLVVLITAAIAGALTLAWAAPAAAHAQLLETDPEDGAQVNQAPEEVVLTFNENIEQIGAEVVITDADGAEVQDGDPQITGPELTHALIEDRPAGQYTVQWRVVSADGHPVSGEFTFEAAEAAGSDAEPADEPEPTEEPATEATEEPAADDPAEDPAAEDPADEPADAGQPVDDAGTAEPAGGFPWGLIFAVAGVAVVLALVVRARNQLRDRNGTGAAAADSEQASGTDRPGGTDTDGPNTGDPDTNP